MNYDFDEVIDRRGTDSEKIDGVKDIWGRDDLIPMWVADMDFRTPTFIINAIKQRLNHEILGYTCKAKEWYRAIVNWAKMRYGWEITPDMLFFSPGIVPGFTMAIQQFSAPGDKVMVQTPVYHPFFLSAQRNNREVVVNPLILENGKYRMDMELFETQIRGCKLLLLCNPHNPGGRVWTKDELQTLARICKKENVLVVSDEIHADITLPPNVHHPFASVCDEARTNSIVFMSPSKAFNMPGIASSYAIIPNEEIRERYKQQIMANSLTEGHVFAFSTVAAAYSNGTEWLEQMLAYIQGNIDYLDQFLKENISAIKMIRPQATYLVFLDCRGLGMTPAELDDLFANKAHLALNNGAMFGKGGEGFMRLNIATPRSVLERAMERLRGATGGIGN